MSAAPINDTIDLRVIFRKLVAKWWLFLLTTTLALVVAVAYLKTTPKQYGVQAVMLMSEKSRSSFGGGQDEFLKGVSYLQSNTDIEDQISVLTSRNNITKTLKRVDLGISYYETYNFLTVERFEYPPFFVKLDTVALQVTGVPIHVSVDRTAGTYRVKAKGSNVQLYNVQKQEVMDQFIEDYSVDQTVAIGEPFVAKNLGFTIEFPARRAPPPPRRPTFVSLVGMPVLVVSGDPGQRHELAGMLRGWRMTPMEADNASMAPTGSSTKLASSRPLLRDRSASPSTPRPGENSPPEPKSLNQPSTSTPYPTNRGHNRVALRGTY